MPCSQVTSATGSLQCLGIRFLLLPSRLLYFIPVNLTTSAAIDYSWQHTIGHQLFLAFDDKERVDIGPYTQQYVR